MSNAQELMEGPASFDDALGGELSGLLGGLSEVYRGEGYERGYRRAINEVLAVLLLATEDYVRGGGASVPDARRAFYGFERYAEERILSLSPNHGYVSGGLGI